MLCYRPYLRPTPQWETGRRRGDRCQRGRGRLPKRNNAGWYRMEGVCLQRPPDAAAAWRDTQRSGQQRMCIYRLVEPPLVGLIPARRDQCAWVDRRTNSFSVGPGAAPNQCPATINTMLFSTPPLQIIDRPADARHMGSGRVAYDFIILHHTGGIDSAGWLSTGSPANNPVSCHRLIARDGRIIKIVPDDHVAYTQGPARIGPLPAPTVNLNNYALSIEFENLGNGEQWPDAQLQAGAFQVAEWWGAHGFIPVLYHKQVQANKNDPYSFPRARFDRFLAARLKAVLV